MQKIPRSCTRPYLERRAPVFGGRVRRSERPDAWLTPAVVGEPPHLEKGNSLATFNRLFTALGLPCAGLPGFSGPYGLPVGIQLLAPRFADVHLLAVAKIVESLINSD